MPSPSTSEDNQRSTIFMSITFLVVVALDQVTKWFVLRDISRGEIVPIIPDFFNLTLTFNKGAAFGILAGVPDGARQVLLGCTTIIALVAVLYFLRRDYQGAKVAQFCLSLILGGAVGNVIDRIRLGEVVDFLDVYWNSYHWPAFNVADSAICIGVVVLLFCRPRSISEKAEKQPSSV